MGLVKNAFDKIGEFDGAFDIFSSNRTTEKNINWLGTNVDIPVAYGEEELPAIWVGFRKISDKKFGALAVFCHAPIEGFDWIEINGLRHVPIPNESGFGTDYQYKQRLGDHGIEYKVQFCGSGNNDFHEMFTDTSNYPLPDDLGTEYPEFFHGLVGVWFEFNVSKGFVTGIPNVTLKTRGRNFIFDPRIDATHGAHYAGWPSYLTFDGSTATACTNPALIRADYLTNKMYGKGLSWDKINVPALIEAANICDTQVPDGDGNNIDLMSFAGRLDTSQKIDKNLELIDKHMRAHSPYHNGQFSLVIRDDAATPDSIPAKWIKKHYEINHGEKSQRLNSCLVTYKEPAYDLDDNQVIWPVPGSEDDLNFLSADGGEVLQEEITLEGCRNRYQAIDYAEAIVRESRLQIETKLDLLAPALKYQAGDVVDVPLKGVGLTRMRISSLDIHDNLDVTWTLQQHSNDSYPWSTKTAIALPAKDESNPLIVSAPGNVAFTPDIYNEHSSGLLTWDGIDHLYVSEYVVSITNTDNGRLVASYKVATTQAEVQNLASGNYSFSVRAVISKANGPETIIAIQITNPEISSISNFRLEEGGTEFIGKDCAFTWSAPSNAVLVVDEYVIEIQHPISGVIYFTDTTKNTHYTFTHAQNLLAGLYRTFKIKAYARGRQGQDNVNTGAAELVVNNPLPALPAGVTVSSTQNTIKLKLNAITEVDFKSVKVWVSLTSGFSPVDGQQITTTRDNQIEIDTLSANTPYYLVYGVLDDFNATTDLGVLSPEIPIHTASDVLSDAAYAVAKADALTDLSSIESLLAVVDGAQKSEQIIQGAAKVSHLTKVKDEQIIVIDQLTVEKDNHAGQITQLQQVDAQNALNITQVQVTQVADKTELQSGIDAAEATQAEDKSELQDNINTVEATASNALSAQTGYCSIGTHSTKDACETAGGTWKEDPLVTALTNAKLNIGGSEVTAGSVFQTLSSNGALKATAGIYVDANGQIAGMFVGANASSSDIVFKADSFKFKTAGGTKTPFVINSDDLIEFDGEINIDSGRVVITDSDINLTYQRFKMAINTEGLISSGYSIGGLDLTTDGVALAAESKESTTAVFKNSRSGGDGIAVFADCNYLGTAFHAEGAEIALDVRSNHYAMKLKESNLTLFPNLWTPGGVNLGDWYLLGDADGIWACNGTTDWKNLLTGATKSQGAALNKNTSSSGSGDAWN